MLTPGIDRFSASLTSIVSKVQDQTTFASGNGSFRVNLTLGPTPVIFTKSRAATINTLNVHRRYGVGDKLGKGGGPHQVNEIQLLDHITNTCRRQHRQDQGLFNSTSLN